MNEIFQPKGKICYGICTSLFDFIDNFDLDIFRQLPIREWNNCLNKELVYQFVFNNISVTDPTINIIITDENPPYSKLLNNTLYNNIYDDGNIFIFMGIILENTSSISTFTIIPEVKKKHKTTMREFMYHNSKLGNCILNTILLYEH